MPRLFAITLLATTTLAMTAHAQDGNRWAYVAWYYRAVDDAKALSVTAMTAQACGQITGLQSYRIVAHAYDASHRAWVKANELLAEANLPRMGSLMVPDFGFFDRVGRAALPPTQATCERFSRNPDYVMSLRLMGQ